MSLSCYVSAARRKHSQILLRLWLVWRTAVFVIVGRSFAFAKTYSEACSNLHLQLVRVGFIKIIYWNNASMHLLLNNFSYENRNNIFITLTFFECLSAAAADLFTLRLTFTYCHCSRFHHRYRFVIVSRCPFWVQWWTLNYLLFALRKPCPLWLALYCRLENDVCVVL